MFYIIIIDFILVLLLLILYKFKYTILLIYIFSKVVTFITVKTIQVNKEQTITIFNRLTKLNQSLFKTIITSYNMRFIGEIQKRIFKIIKINLPFSTTQYLQTIVILERLNQTTKIILRYYNTTLHNIREQPIVLDRIFILLNNFVKYSFTNKTSIQVLYGFRVRKPFSLLRINESEVI